MSRIKKLELTYIMPKYVSDGGYGSIKCYKYDYKKLMEEMRKKCIKAASTTESHFLSGNISTLVVKKFWGRNQYLFAIDCDSPEARDMAISEFDTILGEKVPYAIIESTPNKYWIITEHIGSWKECIGKMRLIPGIDTNFINFCAKHKRIMLRAYPKGGIVPRILTFHTYRKDGMALTLDGSSPSAYTTFPSPPDPGYFFQMWLYRFRNYWQTNEMTWVLDHWPENSPSLSWDDQDVVPQSISVSNIEEVAIEEVAKEVAKKVEPFEMIKFS